VQRIRELAALGVHEVFFRHYVTYAIPHDLIAVAARDLLPAVR
jgi:hypothetical protein